jgi:tRNA (guanine37-N1)-methyltransferase
VLWVNVLTLFPEIFEVGLHTSILGRAAQNGLVTYRVVDVREWTHDRHRTVDDSPYGGGAGMVLKPEPFFEALDGVAVGKGNAVSARRCRSVQRG